MKDFRDWPASAVEVRPLAELTPYAKNARTHSAEQVAQIAASMSEWGFTNPCLIDEGGMVIAGHGRLLAAEQLGISAVPVMVARGWSEAQKQAYVLADNQLALNAGWDMSRLAVELSDLQGLGFEMSLLGFSERDMRAAMGAPGLTDPDEVPEAPASPTAKLGDVWLLGPHRLVCGDATEEGAVRAALGGEKPNLMVTDPPYGVEYDPKWRDDLGIDWTGQAQRLSTHPNAKPLKSRSLGKVSNDDRADWREAWALFPGGIAYVWHGGLHASIVQQSLAATGFTIRAQIIWAKQHFVFSRGDYHWMHEPCWYAVRNDGNWTGDRKQTTIWQIANRSAFHGEKDDADTGHGTQKPVECMRRPIENNSNPGEHVYDPFVGSGTTIIAAEMTGRVCHAIELDPVYIDVAVQRWENFTGQKASLENGLSRNEAAADAPETVEG